MRYAAPLSVRDMSGPARARCRGYMAAPFLLLLALLFALPAPSAPCGQHVVHNDIRSLVGRHQAQKHAHAASGAWRAVAGTLGGDPHGSHRTHHDLRHGHGHEGDESDSEEHGHDHEHGHEHHEFGKDHSQQHSQEGAGNLEEGAARGLQLGDSSSRSRQLQQTSNGTGVQPAPIRIGVNYQRLEALDASQQQGLTRVVAATVQVLRKFIMVKRPVSGGLLADPYCFSPSPFRGCTLWSPNFVTNAPTQDNTCGMAAVLPQHVLDPSTCTTRATSAELAAVSAGASGPASGRGGGQSAYGSGCKSYRGTMGDAVDMYMYITAVQESNCAGGAAAWAQPCLLDLGDDRPLVGGANVCPSALRLLDEEQMVAVLAHEIIHALGFTEPMFNMTHRPDGTPRPLSEVVQPATVGGRTVARIVTPGVRDAARAHFGCPSLPGAALEEEGNAGSAGSHWEYTLFQGEVMVASTIFAADGSPPVLSNMTLSYLEDTGWYVANRSAAGLLAWGANAGCALPTSSCSQYMQQVPDQRLFCDPSVSAPAGSPAAFRCSADYKATGVCRSLNFTGGCGLLLSRNAQQTCVGPDAANDMPDVFGWGTGSPSGRCLPVVYNFVAKWGNRLYSFPANGRDGDPNAACFDTVCAPDGSKVFVKLLGQQFECPAGAYLNLAQLLPDRYTSGRIGPCPSAAALCSTQTCPASSCNPEGGDCRDGRCYCRLAYTGNSCSLNLITGQQLQPIPDITSPTGSPTNSSTGSSPSSSSPSTSSRAPPPPPAQVWVQVIQVSMSFTEQLADVQQRSDDLALVLSSWSDVALANVSVARVFSPLGNATNSTGGTLQPGSGSDASASSQAGEAFSGSAGSGRRRLAQQAPAAANATAASSATAMLTMSNSRATTILAARLRDATQRQQLAAALAQENFTLVPGSLTFLVLISQVTVAPAPPPPPGATSGAPKADDGSTSMTVIIVAAVVGAVAVAAAIIGGVSYMVYRRRRDSAAAAMAGKRAARYWTGSSSGGGGGGADVTANAVYGGYAPPLSPQQQQQPMAPLPGAQLSPGAYGPPPPGWGTGANGSGALQPQWAGAALEGQAQNYYSPMPPGRARGSAVGGRFTPMV